MLVTLTRGTHRVEMMKLSTLASMNVSAGVRCRAVACSGRAAGQQERWSVGSNHRYCPSSMHTLRLACRAAAGYACLSAIGLHHPTQCSTAFPAKPPSKCGRALG